MIVNMENFNGILLTEIIGSTKENNENMKTQKKDTEIFTV